MLACLFTAVACWLVMATAPQTPIGRAMRHVLIDKPAARLLRFTRGDAAVMFLLMIAAAMVTLVGEGDGIRLLTLAAPDVAIWITTFEISAYFDILMALAAAASSLRVRGFMTRWLSVFTRRPAAKAHKRAIRSRKTRSTNADNDDDRHWRQTALAA
ncbi:hypothetical protein IFT67_06515 [Sphingomonas sp. CFBP 13728]|uniref:hypothetical protein n=1 Tax=Sphingomonas sp. CFBP 13728 TaxID=2775294 RepID=UPI00177DC52E|nr:hypothetical protein [Sphingomonas sp. CFBP 13728]MBD8618571.1 hypothetical protein [Sphingomonas sp. CFBP 13728]